LRELYAYTQTGAAPRSTLGWLAVALANSGRWLSPPPIQGADGMPPAWVPDSGAPDALNTVVLRSLDAAVNPFSSITRLHQAAGLKVHAIFFDADVVDAALAIPGRLKIVRGRQKHILRRAGEGLLPARLTRLPKGMLRLRRDRRLRAILEGTAETLLAPAAVRERGLVDPGYVDRLRRRLGRPGYSMGEMYRLWSLLLLEQWCRIFLDARGRRPPSGHLGAGGRPPIL
jgi:hypothetical protein